MLKPHAPSSPTRNPIAHFYFQARNSDGEHTFFFTEGYAAQYAAHHFITQLLDNITDCETTWLSNTELLITHTPSLYTLTIKGELEPAIEYIPTREEENWSIPEPDATHLRRAINFHYQKPEAPIQIPKEKPQRTVPKRHKTTKAPTDASQITVAQIADALNIPPNKARNILRKANVQKPQEGWTFNADDPQVDRIRKLLQAG